MAAVLLPLYQDFLSGLTGAMKQVIAFFKFYYLDSEEQQRTCISIKVMNLESNIQK